MGVLRIPNSRLLGSSELSPVKLENQCPEHSKPMISVSSCYNPPLWKFNLCYLWSSQQTYKATSPNWIKTLKDRGPCIDFCISFTHIQYGLALALKFWSPGLVALKLNPAKTGPWVWFLGAESLWTPGACPHAPPQPGGYSLQVLNVEGWGW